MFKIFKSLFKGSPNRSIDYTDLMHVELKPNTYFYTFELFKSEELITRGTGVIKVHGFDILNIESKINTEVLLWAAKGDELVKTGNYVFISQINKL